MCKDKSETTATVINALIRMKDCLLEAKKASGGTGSSFYSARLQKTEEREPK